MLDAYDRIGHLKIFDESTALPAGVGALPTPGHYSYLISKVSGQQGDTSSVLLAWGNVVHYHAVQFQSPDASFEIDLNRERAIHSRLEMIESAARHGWWVGGAHLPFPGLGHIRVDGRTHA